MPASVASETTPGTNGHRLCRRPDVTSGCVVLPGMGQARAWGVQRIHGRTSLFNDNTCKVFFSRTIHHCQVRRLNLLFLFEPGTQGEWKCLEMQSSPADKVKWRWMQTTQVFFLFFFFFLGDWGTKLLWNNDAQVIFSLEIPVDVLCFISGLVTKVILLYQADHQLYGVGVEAASTLSSI